MAMMELVDAIGRYGLPTVSAGIILWLYLQAERRAAERMDRWERRLLGDGNGRPGRLDELGHQVAAVANQVDTLVARAELSDERRIECERTFKRLHDSIACLQSETSAEITVIRQQVERIAQREDIADAGRIECHRSFERIHSSLADLQSELADHTERIERIECVTLPDAG